MWSLLLLLLLAHIELVYLQGTHRLRLQDGDSPCHGYVEVFYKGTSGYVGDKFWSKNTEKVVCRSIHCGEPVKSVNMYRTTNKTVWLNELQCKGDESSLDQCLNPGWGISFYQKPTVKKIKCSDKISISLVGHQCAGAVQYTRENKKISGYFCRENWGMDQANLVCQSLSCGAAVRIPDETWKDYEPKNNYMKTNCADIIEPKHVWQCVTGEAQKCQPASVICENFKRLQLRGNQSNACVGLLETWKNNKWAPAKANSDPDMKCKQMHCGTAHRAWDDSRGKQLQCTDNVTVVLRDRGQNSRCYGTVYIQKNDKLQPVCASPGSWGQKEAEIICSELNCGGVVQFYPKGASSREEVIMHNVQCGGKESSLWHCQANRGKTQCQNYLYVICTDSVNAKLVDGPGRCAGRLEIMHEGQWKRVHDEDWNDEKSNIICKQLQCGNARTENPEKFMAGSGKFLKVTCDSPDQKKNISECQIENFQSIGQRNDKRAVQITCEAHKVVFLSGACGGEVRIEEGSKTYWLSGSTTTWNKETADTVCQQMHCGMAEDYTSKPSSGMVVWDEPYRCRSSGKDLFECDNVTLPSDHNETVAHLSDYNVTVPHPSDYNETIAHVTCKEKIKMNLTKDCYGHVNFFVQGQSGGVCSDAWTDQESTMLCKQLNCGENIVSPLPKDSNHRVLFKSMHPVHDISMNLTQSNFVKMEDNSNCDPAYVVCSASIKARLNDPRDKCSGNVEIQYEGKWLPMCTEDPNDIDTQNTICREQGCGDASKTLDYFGPTPAVKNQVRVVCPQTAESLKDCRVNFSSSSCDFIGLKCSGWRTVALEIDNVCEGDVIIYSEGKRHVVSSEGWTASEGQQLCDNMNCGNYGSLKDIKSPEEDVWPKNFSCAGVKQKSIWDCETENPPTRNETLYIACKNEPKISLSENCAGELRIDNIQVCKSQWKPEDSHKVCQELSCGNAIDESFENKATAESYHVQCEDHHYRLGQCKRVKGKCDSTLVSISCYHSLQFNTTEKCGGQLQVLHRNAWKPVCDQPKAGDRFKDSLCHLLNCGGLDPSKKPKNRNQDNLDFALECTDEVKDVKYCVKKQQCRSVPAEIYCKDYVTVLPPPPPPQGPSVSIIVGVGLLLVLVILIVVFVRYFLKKGRKSSRMLPGQDVFEEFESGDYEPVESKSNEVEDFGPGTFKSEAEFISENDAPSSSSLPYDDIDEVTEAQPLNPPGATAAASRDSYMNDDDGLDQNGVTYEGEDPQENYDDIDAGPEITQTKAEVHDSSSITPEDNIAAAPPDLVEGDDDYLVPGEEG